MFFTNMLKSLLSVLFWVLFFLGLFLTFLILIVAQNCLLSWFCLCFVFVVEGLEPLKLMMTNDVVLKRTKVNCVCGWVVLLVAGDFVRVAIGNWFKMRNFVFGYLLVAACLACLPLSVLISSLRSWAGCWPLSLSLCYSL